MIRSAASKAMWVGRTTAAVIGLAIALAVVFGVATMALAAVPGDPFKLGKVNSINRLSTLVGTATSPMLRVENKGSGTALNLKVQQGKPPLTVTSTGRVPKLNSDKLDGSDAPLWAVVGSDGTIVRSKGVIKSESGNVGTGAYGIFFNRNVSGCTYTATIGANLHGMLAAFRVDGAPRAVEVRTHDKDGGPSNRPFNLLVNC